MKIFTDEFIAAIREIVAKNEKPISRPEVCKQLGWPEWCAEAISVAIKGGQVKGVICKRGVGGGLTVD